HGLLRLGSDLRRQLREGIFFPVEQIVSRRFRMQHEPIAPVGHQAGNAFESLALLRSLKRYAGERGPESSVFAFHHHHAAAPAVKLVAVIFPERAYVAAVRVVEKEAVSVVDHARGGDEMPERQGAPIVRASDPGQDALITADKTFAI